MDATLYLVYQKTPINHVMPKHTSTNIRRTDGLFVTNLTKVSVFTMCIIEWYKCSCKAEIRKDITKCKLAQESSSFMGICVRRELNPQLLEGEGPCGECKMERLGWRNELAEFRSRANIPESGEGINNSPCPRFAVKDNKADGTATIATLLSNVRCETPLLFPVRPAYVPQPTAHPSLRIWIGNYGYVAVWEGAIITKKSFRELRMNGKEQEEEDDDLLDDNHSVESDELYK
ncbi:hypothetical protein M501DRAFT_1002548 [Patellaria atrata CBS 101060]|uniref:Uncharacterized protein n=1 Tax=Patellaria atrata CBS 101060 TaxID=1346257 RepID=A0A9P4SCS8_9PEZI|nr:hypothetical protein M501DRAFT_1002548 [Patellaria atrata CBS 101060]